MHKNTYKFWMKINPAIKASKNMFTLPMLRSACFFTYMISDSSRRHILVIFFHVARPLISRLFSYHKKMNIVMARAYVLFQSNDRTMRNWSVLIGRCVGKPPVHSNVKIWVRLYSLECKPIERLTFIMNRLFLNIVHVMWYVVCHTWCSSFCFLYL